MNRILPPYVLHGDCRELMPDIVNGAENPIIVTDPPFNIGYHYDQYADKMDDEQYYEMLAKLFTPFPFVVIHYPESIYRLALQMGMFPSRVVSWVYNSNTPRQHRDIAYFGVEPCFNGMGEYKNPTDKRIAKRIADGKKAKGYDWIYCNQIKNVQKQKDAHPCQMPLSVMLYVIGSLPKNATIIDPFAGGGYDTSCRKEAGKKLRWNRDFSNVLPTNQRQTFKRFAAIR